MNLTELVYTKRLKPDGTNFTAAAGATVITSDIVDTQGFDGVRFIIAFGAIVATAVTSTKVQQGQAANMSDAADLAGSAQTVLDTNDDKLFVSDIYRPEERYMRVITSRATANATVDCLIVELYKKVGKEPVATDATVAGVEKFISPPEGTA